jgi:hypothetical protein
VLGDALALKLEGEPRQDPALDSSPRGRRGHVARSAWINARSSSTNTIASSYS